MERLLGATEAKMAPEAPTAGVSTNANPRGPILEEFPMASEGDDVSPSLRVPYLCLLWSAHFSQYESALAPALKEAARERAARKRSLPTGGPASRGPTPTAVTVGSGSQRPPTTFVDMSARPNSYAGAGVVARNERRAEKRRAAKAKKRQGKEAPVSPS